MVRPVEVLICNFGGPTQSSEVLPFLTRLFEDPFIIRRPMPEVLRRWLARKIASKRAPMSDHEYAKIGYSPINRCTQIQANMLESLLKKINPNTRVLVVNRYTPPFAQDVVPQLHPDVAKIFVITLYPHLCHSTTVSSLRDLDLAFTSHYGHREFPSTRIFSWWHHPRYLDLTFASLRRTIEEEILSSQSERLEVIFSAHGIPQRYDWRGDPYVIETKSHFVELKFRLLSWLSQSVHNEFQSKIGFHLSFQSRVGPVAWVKPYTDETIVQLGKSRPGSRVVLVPISFTSDHIETLFEMDCTYKNLALENGFVKYNRVKPPGEDPELAECLKEILISHGFA